MNPRKHLTEWVQQQGGTPQAARKLGIPYQTLRSVVAGWRGVSQDQARAWHEATGGALDANTLVWIRPVRRKGEAANDA